MIQPLNKDIYKKAIELNIKQIYLAFTGGSDEGCCYISFNPVNTAIQKSGLEDEIEEWVWETFDYSGVGEGNDYGDDITYDLVNNTISHEEWSMVASYSTPVLTDLKVSKSDD